MQIRIISSQPTEECYEDIHHLIGRVFEVVKHDKDIMYIDMEEDGDNYPIFPGEYEFITE